MTASHSRSEKFDQTTPRRSIKLPQDSITVGNESVYSCHVYPEISDFTQQRIQGVIEEVAYAACDTDRRLLRLQSVKNNRRKSLNVLRSVFNESNSVDYCQGQQSRDV